MHIQVMRWTLYDPDLRCWRAQEKCVSQNLAHLAHQTTSIGALPIGVFRVLHGCKIQRSIILECTTSDPRAVPSTTLPTAFWGVGPAIWAHEPNVKVVVEGILASILGDSDSNDVLFGNGV